MSYMGVFCILGKCFPNIQKTIMLRTCTAAYILIYANNEPKSVLARDLGDYRDNYEKLAERVSHS